MSASDQSSSPRQGEQDHNLSIWNVPGKSSSWRGPSASSHECGVSRFPLLSSPEVLSRETVCSKQHSLNPAQLELLLEQGHQWSSCRSTSWNHTCCCKNILNSTSRFILAKKALNLSGFFFTHSSKHQRWLLPLLAQGSVEGSNSSKPDSTGLTKTLPSNPGWF